MKQEISLKLATMQGLVLCPYLVVTADKQAGSGINICVVSYLGVVNENPPLIGLSIRPSRYSAKLIAETAEFTVNLPTPELLAAIDYCGTYSGRKIDKAARLQLDVFPSRIISVPGLAKSPIVFECRLQQIIKFAAKKSSHYFYIGQVVNAVRDMGYRLEKNNQLATTNYDYRIVAQSLGKAHKICTSNSGGKKHAIPRKKIS
ncbi:MAG: flavin reductase family protein [Candidatus Parcubacteria bacterium]|nr:flavin reductase family protein [Candidatus Parcubacteria bacterium]